MLNIINKHNNHNFSGNRNGRDMAHTEVATLLLTGTIDASKYGYVETSIMERDVDRRLSQYTIAIEKYIKDSVFSKIVFAENSSYPFNTEYFENLAREFGKEFEFLPCEIHYDETIKGKSYGEVFLIREALQNSKLLATTDEIFKITGRIFLENSKEIVKSALNDKNAFMLIDKNKWCYTFIFKFNKEDYKKYFDSQIIYLLDTYCSMIEGSFYKIITENPDYLDINCFHTWPMLDGVQGGSGYTYKSTRLGKVYHDVLCFLGAYKHNSIFQKLIRF